MWRRSLVVALATGACAHSAPPPAPVAGPLDALFAPPAGRFLHVSSYDTTGGNADGLVIGPGDSAVLLDLAGAGVVRRLWVTVASGDPHYLRRIALKMYWDGETSPSVAAPLGDFFGDGFTKPNYRSIPLGISSGGFFCYFPMPFHSHARIVVENGTGRVVDAFYYNIDLVQLDRLAADATTFHAWWHREPRTSDRRALHLIVAARGRGQYVGTVFEAESPGSGYAFLEGDEVFHVDGAFRGQGTGTEDYFNSGWYFDRGPFAGPFHGLIEKDDSLGRIVAYRWHIPDPIPFHDSVRVEIEHGTENSEVADYATVAYWYQSEPHAPLPPLPPADARRIAGVRIPPDAIPGDSLRLTSGAGGATLMLPVPRPDRYTVIVYPRGALRGTLRYMLPGQAPHEVDLTADVAGDALAPVALGTTRAADAIAVSAAGAGSPVPAAIRAVPVREWANAWNVVGPFPNPRHGDSEVSPGIDSVYAPERTPDLDSSYAALGGRAGWKPATAGADGQVRLNPLFAPHDWVLVYAQAFLYSPDGRAVTLLLGADDAHALWVNGRRVSVRQGRHESSPDDVAVPVELHAGWNRVLLKVANLDGGWAFQLRAADPDGVLHWSARAP